MSYEDEIGNLTAQHAKLNVQNEFEWSKYADTKSPNREALNWMTK